jgi:hypothetical protein
MDVESSHGLKTDSESETHSQQAKMTAPVKPDEGNMSDVETPRMDVSGMKLNSAAKEKTSFL